MNQKLNLMSMEELDRLSQNVGEDKLVREAALRELAKRENTMFISSWSHQLTPMSYPANTLP